MREVDPIRNPSEALLSSALHRLAGGSSRSASKHVGAALLDEFLRHHRVRRQKRMAVIGSIAACVISVILLLSSKSGIRKTKEPPAQQTHAAQPSPASPRPIDHLGASVPKKENAGRTSATTDSDAEDRGFVTLSPYDSAVSASDLAIVRMELTGTDLRLLGAPVTEDLSDQHLLADVIVSGDGTPYAVRIVR